MFLAAFIGSFGAVFLKSGAGRLSRDWRHMIRNWHLPAGVAAYGGSSALFVVGMRHGELSVLYPMISLGYIFTLLWSKLFFGERITVLKVAGIGLILGGIVFLALGNR
jgi:multidrug transporter EmrE-like cation transporter